MSKVYVSLILLLVFAALHSTAQNTDMVIKVADERFEKGDFFGADPIYQRALEIDSSNAEVLFKYGRNLARLNDYNRASKYLYKAYKIDRGRSFIELPLELAEAYRSNGEYRTSRKYYNYALRPYRKNRRGLMYQKINQAKKAASWAKKYKNATSATPVNLGKSFNGEFSEFAATKHQENIYFAALIPDSTLPNNVILDKDYYSKLYESSNGKNSPSPLLFDEKSTEAIRNKHVANPSIYNNSIYFSICDSNFTCEIWKGDFSGAYISNVARLNNNINGGTNNTQPNVVEIDGKITLLFVSDREGGFGGLDIWKSELNSFGFDEAINMGSKINTGGDEISPFFYPQSQELYFSSNWHLGYGGFDIFKSELLNGSFGAAENLKYGINSTSDDYYFQPSTEEALLSSNRKELNIVKGNTCCNDLYKVSYTPREFIIVEEEVNEEILNKYLPLTLYFHNDSPDPNSKQKTTSSNYKRLADEYELLEATYIKKLTSVVKKDNRDDVEFELEEFFEKELRDGIAQLKAFTPLLLKELEKGNQVTLTIKGYASSIANSEYNLNLTLRRIESLVNFFRNEENGDFVPYLDDTAKNGGRLTFEKIPYGEFAVESKVDEKNKIKAVYSLEAIKERKIELLAINSTDPNSVLNLTELPIIQLESSAIDLGEVDASSNRNLKLRIDNKGKGDMRIYNVLSNLPDLEIDFPSIIKSGEAKFIQYRLPNSLQGKFQINLTIVSNAKENLKEIKINGFIAE